MNGQELHHDPAECMKLLLDAPVTLHYLTEGNANVIYSVAPATSAPELAKHDHCCVLRMRKDLATTRPCIENFSAIRQRVTPLFGPEHEDLLMPKALYKLTSETWQQAMDILYGIDDETEQEHSSTSTLRKRHIYHPSLEAEPHAILMPNFQYGEDPLFREFKPKWLIQSPNAPPNARRCRTCAANSFKRSKGGKKGKGDSGFCPLDLLSSNQSTVRDILEKIDPEHGASATLLDNFIDVVQPALHHLANLQSRYNVEGIQDPSNPQHRDYAIAMALRDCSVFLVLEKSSDGDVYLSRVKLADLDLKNSTEGNLEKWAEMESNLISSGAYTNHTMPGSECALERAPTNGNPYA